MNIAGRSKRYIRESPVDKVSSLKERIRESLSSLDKTLIRKIFRKVQGYEHAYWEGVPTSEIDVFAKKNKRHRVIYNWCETSFNLLIRNFIRKIIYYPRYFIKIAHTKLSNGQKGFTFDPISKCRKNRRVTSNRKKVLYTYKWGPP